MAGLYVHIPFCRSKCIYCDFYSTPAIDRIEVFLDALIHEFDRRKDEIYNPFNTIYLGGGTPSVIQANRLAHLCNALPTSDATEFTIEANPDDITPDIIKSWRDLGINRVSMGVQSFDDNQLKAIRRRHNADDARRAIDQLLCGGITNISCDLIYALPDQDLQSWQRSLDALLAYRLPHISAYCLSYEPGTALYARLLAGKVVQTDDDMISQMYDLLCERTSLAGYDHYEISNFSLPGRRSAHNSSYWNGTPYLGLGPGAHSFDGQVRRYNPHDLKSYISSDGNITVIDDETDDERYNDLLITALRTADGLNLQSLEPSRRKNLLDAAAPFLAAGTLLLTDTTIRIPEAEWLRSDAILRELIIA